jgi:hypothetical protein
MSWWGVSPRWGDWLDATVVRLPPVEEAFFDHLWSFLRVYLEVKFDFLIF